jgi:hypothetical protein
MMTDSLGARYGETWADWTEDCRKRSLTELGSSKWYAEHQRTWQLEATGVDFFDADPGRSPLLHDWNWVYMVYCDGHYYAGMNTTQTFVRVPPPPPPAPSASPTGAARSGDALLLQPCEPALAAAQRWTPGPTGQLALSQRGGLCATVGAGEQLQLAPCTDAHDRFIFGSSGQLEVTYPVVGHRSNTSCVAAADHYGLSLAPCSAAPAAGGGLRFNEAQGLVHSAGSCVTAATNHTPPSPAPPPAPPVEIFFRGRYNVEGIVGTLTEQDRLGGATDIVIGGCSSGGVAVFSNADHLHSILPKVRKTLGQLHGVFLPTLGQLQPFIAVCAQECMGQLAFFGPI